ncbi:MAG: ABC transporter permease subunit [Candidatus Ornithospirochaeta sp.]|nr:ABC transporter permease subunit [Candidatus Ornithospirochaeta sp.]
MRKRKEKQIVPLRKDLKKNRDLYIMLIPVVVFFLVFHYEPMYGLQIAFKDFRFSKGILGSPWVGLKHFRTFFSSHYFWRLIRNTLTLSIGDLLIGFPGPIILAIMINEVGNSRFRRTVQTITYLPHFISLVVVCSMVKDIFSFNGLANYIVTSLGGETVNFFASGKAFAPIYIGSNIWQNIGWDCIIYLSALTAIDPQLYEAADIDGAGKLRKILSITLPSILPTIVIMFILKTGKLMSIGSEKVLLLYNPTIYENADIISTFVYRKGLEDANYSYAAAVGLFNSVINFILLFSINRLSRKITESSLW